MNSRTMIALLVGTMAVPTGGLADANEGRRLAELAFASIDTTERGYVDLGQYNSHGVDIFVSMDSDEDLKLSLQEFMGWDYGMLGVAEERNRVDAYKTALHVVFALRDRNGDGFVSLTEHRRAIVTGFQRADTDGDMVLTLAEFTGGTPINVALRAGLDPNF